MLWLVVLLGLTVAGCGPEYPFEHMDVEEIWCEADAPRSCVYIRYRNKQALRTASDVERVSTHTHLVLMSSMYVPKVEEE